MNEAISLLRSYAFVARVAPGLLAAVTPLWATGWVFGMSYSWELPAISAVVMAVVSMAMTQFIRERGRIVEQDMLRSRWVFPTTAALMLTRTSDRDSAVRRRARLRILAPDIELLDENGEQMNEALAKERIEQAVSVLRQRVRSSHAHPVLFWENCAYGFRRNCLGIRNWAMAASLIAATAVLCATIYGTVGMERGGAALGANVLAAIVWGTAVTPHSVRSAANRYSDQLLRELDALDLPVELKGSSMPKLIAE